MSFDDHNIQWFPFAGIEGFVVRILDVDLERRTVDFVIKFERDTRVLVHRHLALTHTFVLKGDHVIYEPNGLLRESRSVGSYTVSTVTGDIHSEGGGPNGCTLLYSVRGDDHPMFDVLDDELKVVSQLGLEEFQQLFAEQATQSIT